MSAAKVWAVVGTITMIGILLFSIWWDRQHPYTEEDQRKYDYWRNSAEGQAYIEEYGEEDWESLH